jgi:hypothetical protein
MQRRHFLQALGGATLALMLPRSPARAALEAGNDTLWVFVDANGGWDPNLFCDPHTHPDFITPSLFEAGDLLVNGQGVPYAPYEAGSPYLVDGADFFLTHGHHLRVINGLDSGTNNHDVGSRHVWSGTMAAGNPAFGALLAATRSNAAPGTLPLAFLSNGGYDTTNRLVPATRIGNEGPLLRLTHTNRRYPKQPDTQTFHPEVLDAILAQQATRTARLREEQGLPQIRQALDGLVSAREEEASLAALVEALDAVPELDGQATSPLLEPARIGLAAMAAGICTSLNLSLRGFDTHGGHDLGDGQQGGHRPRLQEVFDAIHYVLTVGASLGLADRLVVVATSDFGRTRYNAPNLQIGDAPTGAGKDHWPITSALVLGAGVVPGVIGQTSVVEGVSGVVASEVVTVDGDVVPTEDPAAPDATLIAPLHLHHILRCMAGIKDHPLALRYPVHRGDDVPLPLIPGVQGSESFAV